MARSPVLLVVPQNRHVPGPVLPGVLEDFPAMQHVQMNSYSDHLSYLDIHFISWSLKVGQNKRTITEHDEKPYPNTDTKKSLRAQRYSSEYKVYSFKEIFKEFPIRI